jgi:diguanylate cyclase (GGDEF)-like protein
VFTKIYDKLSRLAQRATLPTDSDEERTKKGVLTMVAGIIAVLAIFWGSGYVILGYPLSGSIPLSYAAISFLSIGYFFATKKFAFFRFSQLLLILWLPFLLQWSLGGFANGSVVMIWAFFTPLAAMLFSDAAHATKWLFAFLILTIVSGIIDSSIRNLAPPMEAGANISFFVLNMGFGCASVFIVLNYFVKERESSLREVVAARGELEHANKILLQNESRIRELMLTDPLTGLGNRRHLDESLQIEISRAHRYGNGLCVVMTDLDHFKKINDTYGHNVGDKVLQAFAKTLQQATRTTDFVARFGGEEFILVLPETTLQGAMQLAERIRATVEETNIPGIQHTITASFGITAMSPRDCMEEILLRADRALYCSKENGRNRITQLA